MKLEIEISPEEIKSAIERKIRVAIADQTNNYMSDELIKREVKKQWNETMQRVVGETLADSAALRAKVEKVLEAKIKGQLNALMKGVKSEQT